MKTYNLCNCDFEIWGCEEGSNIYECRFCEGKCEMANSKIRNYIPNIKICICPYCWQTASKEKKEDIFALGAGIQSILNEFYQLGKTAIFKHQWGN